MPDMYDKLGEMLNEALESGEIPQNKPDDTVVEPVETTAESGSFILNDGVFDKHNHNSDSKKHLKSPKKQKIPTGEVIKLHKYTYNMQYPPQIQKALITLDIAYPFTQKDIITAYHKKLKETHPDTKNTIQHSNTVHDIRHYTVDEVRNYYEILCSFFGIK